MIKKGASAFFVGIVGLTFFVPMFLMFAVPAHAEGEFSDGLVHCGRKADGEGGITTKMCTFDDLIILAGRIIRWVFTLIAITAAVVVVYIGWLFLSAGGNTEALGKAKSAAKNWLIGVVLVLSAWLIVSFVLRTLLSEEYLRDHPNAILLDKVDTSGQNKSLQDIVTGK